MPFPHGHALVIGVDAYTVPAYRNLMQVGADATALRDVLIDPTRCGYSPVQVTLLTGAAATRAAILQALDALAQRTTVDDTVLISYTGHGVLGPAKRGYFLTATDSRADESGAIVPTSAISDTTLLGALRAITAGKLLVILNACHSGNAAALGADSGDATPPPDRIAAILGSGSGRAVITACTADQVSWLLENDPTTLFGAALLAGLRGEGTDNPRHPDYVGLYDLFTAISERLAREVPRKTQRAVVQQPVLTVLAQSGPFPVALFPGATALGSFDVGAALPAGDDLQIEQVRASDAKRAYERLAPVVQNIGHNAGANLINTNQSGGINLQGSRIGTIGTLTGGNAISTAEISGSGNAIGRGARSISTGGGDYAGRDIDKRHGTFVSGDQFNLSGNFTGANVTIKSTLSNVAQTIGAATIGDAATKAELQRLIAHLNAQLQRAPVDKANAAEAVAETAKAVIEQATKPQPNHMLVQITAEGLKAAAQNLAAVLPAVLPIATQIADASRKLVGSV